MRVGLGGVGHRGPSWGCIGALAPQGVMEKRLTKGLYKVWVRLKEPPQEAEVPRN